MGCISSKQAVSADSPAFEFSVGADNVSLILDPSLKTPSALIESEEKKRKKKKEEAEDRASEAGKSAKGSSNGRFSLSFRFGNNVHKVGDAEKTAAGWPGWLSAVAGEAIHGWVPLRADSFEKLEKIGQGTYSSVFKARDVGTGKIFALKKVRFDNFQPESIRFMAREIMVLRRLDHPNIMKLEGIITSRLSCSIYLVFEYMEHDLSGLISNPNIKFSDAQIKCYMQQLLYGLEHCHMRGVMHRDIKTSNILINNQGVLKVADFGLANFLSSRHKQQLTSRVVTLWYRPPELLLGSTNYGASVDLWSVGCVFAEILIGKPILKGRTEVEQLHKIFKLCGSPPEEFWKKSKLPHATIFKPQHPYESSLRERCKEFPTTAVNLIETFLSIDTHNRGTASSALLSEYFNTKPFACDPSSLPKYPPSKEIDAKSRDEAQRRKVGLRTRGPGASRKPRRVLKAFEEANDLSKVGPKEVPATARFAHRNRGSNAHFPKRKGSAAFGMPLDTVSEVSQMSNSSQGDVSMSGQLQFTPSSNFSWAKGQNLDAASTRSYGSTRSQASGALDKPSYARHTMVSKNQENEDVSHGLHTNSRGRDSYRRTMQNRQTRFGRPESFDASDVYHSEELSAEALGYKDQRERVDYSGPLLSQSQRIDELWQKHENHIRQTVRKSRLQKVA